MASNRGGCCDLGILVPCPPAASGRPKRLFHEGGGVVDVYASYFIAGTITVLPACKGARSPRFLCTSNK